MWQAATDSRKRCCAGAEGAQELPLQGRQPGTISGTMTTGTHTSLTQLRLSGSNRKCIMKQQQQQIYIAVQRCSLLHSFRRNAIWGRAAAHRPVCTFVRKVTTVLLLMLTRGSLLEGECQTRSHSCFAVAACVAHVQQQIRSLLLKAEVV